ncbi:uncharacterized protein LOC123556675 isoform X2 [Mercenaria mercenaria]|nr:uncharacterized protein LOC123556675 isoform X2 [Mercenaria mercenaria]
MEEDKISEKQILLVFAHHLFEPLLPRAEMLVDEYVGIDASKCPFCPGKNEAVKSGTTSFGVPGMWHGKADIIIKHGKVQQAVAVRQGSSGSSGEPAAKRQRMDSEEKETESSIAGEKETECSRTGLVEVKKDLNWKVTRKSEQDQDPVPQILSQTIVNAFLVAKVNQNLKNFFIPSFLVSPKGVRLVMYNLPNDSLVTQVECQPVLFNKELNRRVVFTIWLALNFDKFCLDKSVKIIEKFLKPCGFRSEILKYGVKECYEQNVREGVEERPESNDVYRVYVDTDARLESWKVLSGSYTSPKPCGDGAVSRSHLGIL